MSEVHSDIFVTQDGSHSVYSATYGVPYHSKYGAIQESVHVFIEAGLNFRLPSLEQVRILEMGFGSGLNALLTQRIARQAQKAIHYTAIEAYPLSLQAVEQLNYPAQMAVPSANYLHLHTTPWNEVVPISSFFTLERRQVQLQDVELKQQYDVIYFDAFAPTAQPELWTEDIFRKLFAATALNGVLVTYCAKGVVKRAMKAAGYTVERLPGPPGKREMTRAIKLA